MTAKSGTTLTEINRTIKRILDHLTSDEFPFGIVTGGVRTLTFSGVISKLTDIVNTISTLKSSIESLLAADGPVATDTQVIRDRMISTGKNIAEWADFISAQISAVYDQFADEDFSSETTLASLDAKDFSTETTLALVLTKLTEIESAVDGLEGVDYALNSSVNDVEASLTSIDGHVDDISDLIGGLAGTNAYILAMTAILASQSAKLTHGGTDISEYCSNIDDNTDGIEGKLDDLKTLVDEHGYVAASSANYTLSMTNGDLTKQMAVDASDVVEMVGMFMSSSDATSRDVEINLRIGSISYHLTTITIQDESIEWSDAKFDELRDNLISNSLDSNCEIQAVASGVTATKGIVLSIGTIKRVD